VIGFERWPDVGENGQDGGLVVAPRWTMRSAHCE